MVTLFGKEKASKSSYGPDVGDNIGTSVSHLKTTLSKHSFASFRCFEKHSVVWSVRNQLVMNDRQLAWASSNFDYKGTHIHTRTLNLKGCSGLTHQTLLDRFAAWYVFEASKYVQVKGPLSFLCYSSHTCYRSCMNKRLDVYEAKIKWKGQQLPGVEPRTPGLCSQCSDTELRQLDNHQPSQPSICTAQVVLKCLSSTPDSMCCQNFVRGQPENSLHQDRMFRGFFTFLIFFA